MLWEHNSTIVVMLSKQREMGREKCHQYWPSERSARYQYFVVDPMAEYNMPQYVLREFKVTDARVSLFIQCSTLNLRRLECNVGYSAFRTDNRAQCDSSSSQIGLSREFQSLAKVSSTSSDKFTKRKNSSAKKVPSPYTAGAHLAATHVMIKQPFMLGRY